MKKTFFFLAGLAIFLSFGGCKPSTFTPQVLPNDSEKVDELHKKSIPQKKEADENPLKYDQMILGNLNKPFQLKLTQSAQVNIDSKSNFILTPKKIIGDSRCTGLISLDGAPIPNCAWLGQVLVLVEILDGNDIPTSLQISSIKPTIYHDFAIVLTKVEPAKTIRKGKDGGIDWLPIAPDDYTFHFEVKKAVEIETKTPTPPQPLAESSKEKILKEAKPFLPFNGIGFFSGGTNNNHRIIVDFDTSVISYAITSSSSPFYDNSDVKGYRVRVTPEDLKKIYDLGEDIPFLDEEEENIANGQITIIAALDGEAAIYSSSKDIPDEVKKLRDFIVNFTIIEKSAP